MTYAAPIPTRTPSIDRWSDLDAEDDRIADDLFSGRHDAKRLRGSAQALAMIAECPPAPKADPVEARRKEAMAGLVRDYLDKIGGRL